MALLGLSCVFPVPGLKATARFYADKLGFRAVGYLGCAEKHVCLYRDGVEIILLQAAGEVVPNRRLYGYGYDAYLYAADQGALEAEFSARGVKIVRPLATTDYQNREFVIEDLDGRWLAFGLKEK